MVLLSFAFVSTTNAALCAADRETFLEKYCYDCHGPETQEAGLNLRSLSRDLDQADAFRLWVKVHDRIASGEMPPKAAEQPPAEDQTATASSLSAALVAAENSAEDRNRSALRRLTRAEYENTVRDLFKMPGIALSGILPADGSAYGYDKNADALEISHVNVAKYIEAADHVLNYAIATRPVPPLVQQRRISLANRGGFVAHIIMNGDGVQLQDRQLDPQFPPAGDQNHLDQGAHERFGSFDRGSSVGLFRHEDESVSPYFIEHVTIYPGLYRVRTSLWGFQWDKGAVLPGRGTEAARLSVVQLTGDGRGGQHPSYVLGYFNAPADEAQEHELNVWLNHNELIGFNTASLAPVANYARKGRAMAFTGPGIVCDWLDIEGPLHTEWPPHSHQLLFGDLPIQEFSQDQSASTMPPNRIRVRQLGAGMNRLDPEPGLHTVRSKSPRSDADCLLAESLPKIFRRPVDDATRQLYLGRVEERLAAGDSFEAAMRSAYRTALCSPSFLYHLEPGEPLDNYALACRLSYFLWNSLPDEQLMQHAARGELRNADTLQSEVERMLADPKSDRFVEDFLGQWMKLRLIAANDPDRKLYPEFSPYLQDSMIAETRAFFRELIDQNLGARNLVKSDFVMLNQKLAAHYGIPDCVGTQIRRITPPEGCPRGGFLTQAAVLKITANGTTTSPVPRGAFVMDRLLGQPPEPPPSNVAAIEPDVRGATTIREQLAKHRDNVVCASCHSQIDPPGFALESFDVIGGFRTRYRSIGDGDPAERGVIDPFIPINFQLGPTVDASGVLPDGHTFRNITEYQQLLSADADALLENLSRQLLIYSTGRPVRFSDRPLLDKTVSYTQQQGGGIRTLIHEIVLSPLFHEDAAIGRPATPAQLVSLVRDPKTADISSRMMLTAAEPAVESPIRRNPDPLPAPIAVMPPDDSSPTVRMRITGLYAPERINQLRQWMSEFSEVKLKQVDFETTEALFAYQPDCDLFRYVNAEQLIDRFDNRLRQLSHHTIGAKPLCTIPRDQLEFIEIPIFGLDCPACCLAASEILSKVPGVEQATASFRDHMATAWIDPKTTNRDALLKALTDRGVELEEKVAR